MVLKQKYLFGIKELQLGVHRFGQQHKYCPIREQKSGLFKDKMENLDKLFIESVDWCCFPENQSQLNRTGC